MVWFHALLFQRSHYFSSVNFECQLMCHRMPPPSATTDSHVQRCERRNGDRNVAFSATNGLTFQHERRRCSLGFLLQCCRFRLSIPVCLNRFVFLLCALSDASLSTRQTDNHTCNCRLSFMPNETNITMSGVSLASKILYTTTDNPPPKWT